MLTVIPLGERNNVVSAYITRSRLWDICQIFEQKQNMRLNKGNFIKKIKQIKNFSRRVLNIGGGNTPLSQNHCVDLDNDQILIPNTFCNMETENSVENMISTMYTNFETKWSNSRYLSERAILTLTNQKVGQLNSMY